MLKMMCICDRCGKEFEAKQAQRIVFESVISPEETLKSKLVDMIVKVFPSALRDYCPECVSEIKEFSNNPKSISDKGMTEYGED